MYLFVEPAIGEDEVIIVGPNEANFEGIFTNHFDLTLNQILTTGIKVYFYL